MTFRLPYSRRKRYLTGIDWVVNTLDSMTRKATGHGNSSQVILSLTGRLDTARLTATLAAAAAAFPVLGGRVRRDWNLCPYLALGRTDSGTPPVTVVQLPRGDFQAALDVLEQHVQEPFSTPGEHVRFKVVHYGNDRSLLGMHFDHRLLDAFGAELFLELLARMEAGTDADACARVALTEPAHLDHWIRRFVGGRNVNRLQVRLSRGGLAAFPRCNHSPPRPTVFDVVTFTGAETAAIHETAGRESGPFMILPSLLARVLLPLHRLIQRRVASTGHYVVPVSIVRRQPEAKWETLFFNHLSFIVFQVPVEAVGDDIKALSALLRDQLYEQMKAGVAEDIEHASMLTRIAPLPMMRQFARIPMKGRVASSYFACLKGTGFESVEFMGVGVENLIHTPHVPPEPGVGVFLNFFNDRLNLVLSRVAGVLDDAEAAEWVEQMKDGLLAMGQGDAK